MEGSVDLGWSWLCLLTCLWSPGGSAGGWLVENGLSWATSAWLDVVSYPPLGKPGLVVMVMAGFWARVEVHKLWTVTSSLLLHPLDQIRLETGFKKCPHFFMGGPTKSHCYKEGWKIGANCISNLPYGLTSWLVSFCFFFSILQAYHFFFKLIYFWLCWVFVSVWGLSLVVASGGHSSSRRVGLSLSRSLLRRSTGSRCAGSVVMAHGPSCSAACGIFSDQGLNPCPLHWQADSQPLCHQGSPGQFS